MSEPRSEPEIIPPDRVHPERGRDDAREWISVDAHGTRRIYIRRIGPLGFVLVALLIAVLAALFFVIVLGVFLLWIPVAILLFVAAIVGGLLRRSARQ